MLRQLIVNADDLGYTPGVTKGILRAHLEGVVTSTSVLVNMPAAQESIQLALTEAPELGLGLHFNITAGKPISEPDKISDLVNDAGNFKRKSDIARNLGVIKPEQFDHEFRAQIAHFIDLVGQTPDHFDSHHHISYLHPAITEVMLVIAEEFDVPIRCPLPHDTESAASLLSSLGLIDPETSISSLIQDLQSLLSDTSVKAPDNFIAAYFGDYVALGDLLNILIAVPKGRSELMCHPGEIDKLLAQSSGYIEPRVKELEALTHPAARELINAEFIQLISFKDLK